MRDVNHPIVISSFHQLLQRFRFSAFHLKAGQVEEFFPVARKQPVNNNLYTVITLILFLTVIPSGNILPLLSLYDEFLFPGPFTGFDFNHIRAVRQIADSDLVRNLFQRF